MILIVDDREENLISLKKVLEVNHFEVDTANSGEEALKKILKHNYVLIILDVQMPGMDGFEVAEIISGFSKTKETAIIFLSAVNTDLKFVTKGYSSGAIDYITKPVDINLLLLKVKTLYRIYEQSRILQETQHQLKEEIAFRKRAERKKDEFISIASHELKTPLTSIKGYIQLLQIYIDRNEDISSFKNHLKKASQQVEKLNNLIVDLLDISKIESGKMQFDMKPFRSEEMVESVVEDMAQNNPKIKLELYDDFKTELYADRSRLEQVIINFITNAIKYAPDSERICIRTKKEGAFYYLGVQDYGMGIPKNQQHKIFDKFFRVEHNGDHFNGLGIGLYICSEIITRHQGIIGLESAPNEGSEFYFKLPLQAAVTST